MSLNFYNDYTKVNITGVGFIIEEPWYLEFWTLYPYVLVWFSMSRLLVRRDISSIFFYIGLMIHEVIGYFMTIRWKYSVVAHFTSYTAWTLRNSCVSRTRERSWGLAISLVIMFFTFLAKWISKKEFPLDIYAGSVMGSVTGYLWYMAMRLIDDNMLWNTLLIKQTKWNVLMLRHTRGITQKTLFAYFLTQELNNQRNNERLKSIKRVNISNLTTESTV